MRIIFEDMNHEIISDVEAEYSPHRDETVMIGDKYYSVFYSQCVITEENGSPELILYVTCLENKHHCALTPRFLVEAIEDALRRQCKTSKTTMEPVGSINGRKSNKVRLHGEFDIWKAGWLILDRLRDIKE